MNLINIAEQMFVLSAMTIKDLPDVSADGILNKEKSLKMM